MRIITLEAYDRLSSLYYLNKAVSEYKILSESYANIPSIISEEVDDHHYEWDFTTNKFYDRINNIEADIKKSASFVRTADQAVNYIKDLSVRVAELPDKIKSDFAKVAIAAMALSLSYTQLVDVDKKVDTLPKNNMMVMVGSVLDNVISKKEKSQETKVAEKYSDKLINTLKKHEGIGGEPVLTAYNIGDGAYTIGYGHAVFKKESRGDNSSKYDFLVPYAEYDKMKSRGEKVKITSAQAEQLLRDDVKVAADGLDRLLDEWKSKGINPKITQPMYDAMVSMIYNMGINEFRESEFIQLVKRGKFKEAAEAIKNTSSQMFRKYPGLIDRRNDESEMFKGNYPI